MPQEHVKNISFLNHGGCLIRSCSVFLLRSHTQHSGSRVQQQVEEVPSAEAAVLHGLRGFTQMSTALLCGKTSPLWKKSHVYFVCRRTAIMDRLCWPATSVERPYDRCRRPKSVRLLWMLLDLSRKVKSNKSVLVR